MPARSIATASISFGLVSIPVKIFSTGEPSHEIHFHMVHKGCGQRVHQQLVCPKHGEVDRKDISKGYEASKGHVIELEPSELEALEAVATGAIEIREFVPAAAVDPIYVDRSYYLGPGKGGNRAYRLLRDALDHAGLCAVGAYAARGKAYIVMLRPFEDGLAMHQLRYADEVKPWDSIDVGELPKPAKGELELAHSLVSQLERDEFDPTRYHDEVKQRVQKLLADKVKNGEVIEAPEPGETPAPVTDLMAALKASLGDGAKPGKQGAKSARRASTHERGVRKYSRASSRARSKASPSNGHSRARGH